MIYYRRALFTFVSMAIYSIYFIFILLHIYFN